MQLNPHYAELNESYLFSTIAHKVADYQKAHPEADVIRLGIGDVTLPLAASVPRATWATCWTCSVRTTRSLFPTRSTRSTSMTT